MRNKLIPRGGYSASFRVTKPLLKPMISDAAYPSSQQKRTNPSPSKLATSGRNGGNGHAQADRQVQNSTRSVSASTRGVKTFVLDTNVLLHDPACLDRFEEHEVCIPVDVLSELDRFKNEMTERGANAREVHRSLTKAFSSPDADVVEGVPTTGGGHVRLVMFDPEQARKLPALQRFQRVFPALEQTDHRILACALWLSEKTFEKVILVTKDLNMQLKARAVGVECEDYLHDKVEAREALNLDIQRLTVTAHEMQRFSSSGRLSLEPARTAMLAANEYVLLLTGEKGTIPARFTATGEFVRLHVPESLHVAQGRAIKPMNLGQQCFLDALMNPEIALVTAFGQAGTGKTLLAVAAGLSQVMSRIYTGLTVSRPIVAMGQGIGFLPGSLQEKMRPWLQPVYDALDLLMRPAANPAFANKKKRPTRFDPPTPMGMGPSGSSTPYDPLIQQGIIEIEALCYIRGRSIPDRFFVLDEAQQLTPLEAKTVVTRMSRGSKLVLVGDPGQIDNPYVDSRSNGLVYTRQRMRGQPFAAHIPLVKGERSPLAEAGARLL
jgi:PhoH-like ATPase